MRRIMVGAASGILAAGFGVAAAELLAAATRPQAGPLVAVGGAVIEAESWQAAVAVGATVAAAGAAFAVMRRESLRPVLAPA